MAGLGITRREGESFVIDGDIVVTIVEISGSRSVRLRIEAPPEVEIRRSEHLEGGERDHAEQP